MTMKQLIHILYTIIIVLNVSLPAIHAQTEVKKYLYYSAEYESNFSADEAYIEQAIFNTSRDLMTIYRRGIDRLNRQDFDNYQSEWTAIFSSSARHINEFSALDIEVAIDKYIRISKEEVAKGQKLSVVDMSIQDIETLSPTKSQYLATINITKVPTGQEDEQIWLQATIIIDVSDIDNVTGTLSHVFEGVIPESEKPKLKHWHALTPTAGIGFQLGDIDRPGFSRGTSPTVSLGYQYFRDTHMFNKRLSFILGGQVRYHQHRVTVSEGASLMGEGFPNRLELTFITEGNETMHSLHTEAQLGIDIRLGKDHLNYWGIAAILSPRLASYSTGRFTGALEYRELWGDNVVISDIINCGLQSFEGADAADATFSGRVFDIRPGILIRPYYRKFEGKLNRMQFGLDLQFVPRSLTRQGDLIFLRPFNETTDSSRPQIAYSGNPISQNMSPVMSELYLGVHISYFIGKGTWATQAPITDPLLAGSGSYASFEGKAYLILSGDLSDAEAAKKIKNELGPATQFIWIINTTKLENVAIPDAEELLELRIINNEKLKYISMPGLREVFDKVSITDNPLFEEWDAKNLERINELSFQKNNSYENLLLPQISNISNAILISNNKSLKSLDLPQIYDLKGEMTLTENPSLHSIYFNTLEAIQGDISLYSLEGLETVNFPSIRSINGALSINQNNALKSISLENLKVTGSILQIQTNPHLQSIHLPALKKIGSDLVLNSNDSLSEVVFEQLEDVEGNLQIFNCIKLKEVNLPSLSSIHKELNISGLPVLSQLSLTKLASSGALAFNTNESLELIDLPLLNSVRNHLILESSIIDTLHIPNLNTIGLLYLVGNFKLKHVHLPKLDSLTDHKSTRYEYENFSLWIERNNALSVLELPVRHIHKNLFISDNVRLEKLDLNELKTAGNISIRQNPSLRHLDFNKLSHINGSLEVVTNLRLQRIHFPDLMTVEQTVEINYNSELRHIRFDVIEKFGSRLMATNNALDRSTVNHILSRFASQLYLPEIKMIYLDNQIPPSPPSGKGLSDKNTLIKKGYDVLTD